MTIDATKGVSSTPDEANAAPPKVAPGGYGGGDFSPFVWQSLGEIRGSLGELKSSIDGLKTSVEGVKKKVDDLTSWKNRILGGAVVLGAVCTLLGYGITKLSSYVTFKDPNATVQAAPEPAAQSRPAPKTR